MSKNTGHGGDTPAVPDVMLLKYFLFTEMDEDRQTNKNKTFPLIEREGSSGAGGIRTPGTG